MRGRFRYRETGLLDRTQVRFFTLETIRELMSQAGLVVVDTKRVVVPLFQSELSVKRGTSATRRSMNSMQIPKLNPIST